MEEKYKWMHATVVVTGRPILVRQRQAGLDDWVDTEGAYYQTQDLDLTQATEQNSFLDELNGRLQRSQEESERTQKQFSEMLANMDTKAIADHQAEIDERAYWRKLRGDIALEILRGGDNLTCEQICENVSKIFNKLYAQDVQFFNVSR